MASSDVSHKQFLRVIVQVVCLEFVWRKSHDCFLYLWDDRHFVLLSQLDVFEKFHEICSKIPLKDKILNPAYYGIIDWKELWDIFGSVVQWQSTQTPRHSIKNNMSEWHAVHALYYPLINMILNDNGDATLLLEWVSICSFIFDESL